MYKVRVAIAQQRCNDMRKAKDIENSFGWGGGVGSGRRRRRRRRRKGRKKRSTLLFHTDFISN
jgi:hypothetical protein